MSHYSEHKRRFLSIGPKLVRFVQSDTFDKPKSCSDQLDDVLLLIRRDARFQTEKYHRYLSYKSDRNWEVHKGPGWWEQHPDWHILYTDSDPKSVYGRVHTYAARCVRKNPR